MSFLSLDLATPVAAASSRHKRLFARILHAIYLARARKAEQVIQQYRHLLPPELESAGDTLTSRTEDRLPFVQ